jgi:Cys-tRNA(Pro)/Cys-tRNA(Cys) deacylase
MEPTTTPAIESIAVLAIPYQVVRIGHVTSAAEAANAAGVPLTALLRTIVVRRGPDDHLLVVAPASRQFDWAKLRAHLGVSRLSLPDAAAAKVVTGYERGTITPFGTTTPLPVVVDVAVLEEAVVSIGGGAHGVQLQLAPADLVRATGATVVALG